MQPRLTVSKPSDPLEREAEATAVAVNRKPEERVVQRDEPGAQVQRSSVGAPVAPALAPPPHTAMQGATTGGQALPSRVRDDMEPRLGADLGDVRIHADDQAASLSNHLSAQAFTYRNHVFFGRGQYRPETDAGRHLLAHELTHTIQQGATVQRQAARHDVDRMRPEVSTPGGTPTVQRLGVQDALDYFADKAHHIPGFRMLTLILGFNPVNQRSVARTPANFLRALIELVPGGALITRALDNHGVTNEAAEWVDQKVSQLGDIGAQIVTGLRRFIDSLSWTDIFDLGGVWDRAKRIFTDPISSLISFGTGVVIELLAIVKRVILRPLAALAEGTPGYDLLKAVLEQDPVTGEPYPRTAETLIGGFMKLIGQEEVWLNIKRGNAVGRAFTWFQGALAGLMGFVRSIPGHIVQTLRSLTFQDVVTVVGAFRKVSSAFLGLAGRFISWAGGQVLSLLEILFSVVAPGVMPYIAKARAAFHQILRNPVGFVRNLVRAGRLGFEKFAHNIVTHLKAALISWLTGPLGEAGVHVPRSFSLVEVVKLVLSVLGLTWQNVRGKLVKVIPDPVLGALEKSAAVLTTLVSQGPAAAWAQVQGELTELKTQLISQVTGMIQTEVVKAAVTKLVSMINPAGAVVQAIIAVYNTVTFFVAKARQIGAVVASFVDSISAIAAGSVDAAANRVEQTMARTLTVMIAFLAKFAGLGSIPDKLVGIVRRIRQPVDTALDKIVGWLAGLLSKLLASAREGAKRLLMWWRKKEPVTGGDQPHTLTFTGEKRSAQLVIRSEPEKPSAFLTNEHGRRKQEPATLTKPLAATQKHEREIVALQTFLASVDDNERAAAAGPRAKQADAMSATLDTTLRTLATVIGQALTEWGGEGAMPDSIEIERSGGFTVTQKAGIAREYLAQKARLVGSAVAATSHLVKDARGREINVAADIDRRHVVSSDDMAKHYGSFLAKKPLSQAKLLLEQRGSIEGARQPVEGKRPNAEAVLKAAVRRYRRFFGYAKNIFLGDSSENRSIQQHLDAGHPEMAGQKLRDHVQRIKRGWALDSSFEPSEK
ncbi:DUF4157 domain-containing protein [Nocardioides sp.]|uniref:eCIS core domain-containing protein n=1 Tax=Nocardioides sp. TaxID=35761 RepID=UPI0035AE5FAE